MVGDEVDWDLRPRRVAEELWTRRRKGAQMPSRLHPVRRYVPNLSEWDPFHDMVRQAGAVTSSEYHLSAPLTIDGRASKIRAARIRCFGRAGSLVRGSRPFLVAKFSEWVYAKGIG